MSMYKAIRKVVMPPAAVRAASHVYSSCNELWTYTYRTLTNAAVVATWLEQNALPKKVASIAHGCVGPPTVEISRPSRDVRVWGWTLPPLQGGRFPPGLEPVDGSLKRLAKPPKPQH